MYTDWKKINKVHGKLNFKNSHRMLIMWEIPPKTSPIFSLKAHRILTRLHMHMPKYCLHFYYHFLFSSYDKSKKSNFEESHNCDIMAISTGSENFWVLRLTRSHPPFLMTIFNLYWTRVWKWQEITIYGTFWTP